MKNITAGFDGYIDRIFRPMKKGTACFETMKDFSTYIKGKAPSSFAIRMREEGKRIGGNAPNVTKTLRALGHDVTLIGMLGEETPDPIFAPITTETTITYRAPGETMALEFGDSKIFLYAGIETDEDILEKIEKKTKNPRTLLSDPELLIMVNWGEIDFMHHLWTRVAEKYIIHGEKDKTKKIFIDTADMSGHTVKEIRELFILLRRLSEKRHVVLGLNRNEAGIAADTLETEPELEALFNALKVDELVLHSRTGSSAMNEREGKAELQPVDITCPVLSTGAGDSFNAGYCDALLDNLLLKEKLLYANTSAHYYMTHGMPSTKAELVTHMEKLFGDRRTIDNLLIPSN